MRKAKLVEVALPDFGEPVDEPVLPRQLYEARLQRLRQRMVDAGFEILVIYADREHCANLAWLSGFDPRFEEAVLVLRPQGVPLLLAGIENVGMGRAAPLPMEVRLHRPFGLMGQTREGAEPLADVLRSAGVDTGARIGVAGWKYATAADCIDPLTSLEVPSYLADALREIAGDRASVINAGPLLMDPDSGLRSANEIDQIARFEFAACHTSSAIRRAVLGARPGMREFDVAALFQPIGLPHNCHPMMSSGPRAAHGLPSPSSRRLERGDPVTAAFGVWGALNCRAGFLVQGADELPAAIRDYVDRLVAPYFESIAEWLASAHVGVTGGVLDAAARRRLGDPFFGMGLNPGHLLHIDEWMHSPVSPGSSIKLKSGTAIQIDIIPATGSPWFTTNAEDGIALLDERGRSELAERFPAVHQRVTARRAFVSETIGINLHADVCPLSNIPCWLPPFWLAPQMAMAMR